MITIVLTTRCGCRSNYLAIPYDSPPVDWRVPLSPSPGWSAGDAPLAPEQRVFEWQGKTESFARGTGKVYVYVEQT